jgi:hypothetical protein
MIRQLRNVLITLCAVTFGQISSTCADGLGAGPQKRALIIGISNYSPESGWGSINAENDIQLLEKTFLAQDFKAWNISILRDSQATKEFAVRQIESLISKSNRGDIVHIHFSGHGQRITDKNGDEDDGYDEALVFYNGKAVFDSSYNLEGHLTDDELGILLHKLAEKVGFRGQVVMSIDAANTGPDSFNPDDLNALSSRGGMIEDIPIEDFDQAPIFLFSASLANELAYEFKGYGAWTYAFAAALKDTLNEIITFQELQRRIANEVERVAPRQTSTFSGPLTRKVYHFSQGNDTIKEKKLSSKSNFYVLTIGVQNYNLSGINVSFKNCNRDARIFGGAIQTNFERHSSNSENFHRINLIEEDATLEAIEAAINTIINNATKDDYFFFNFSGFTITSEDENSKPEIYFIPHIEDEIVFRSYKPQIDSLRHKFLSLSRLKDLLVFIPCKNQFILSEAGSSKEFTSLFTKALIETSPSIMEMDKRNRVIMVPKMFGSDQTSCKGKVIQSGPLSYFLSELIWEEGLDILDLFLVDAQKRARVAYSFLRMETSCGFKEPYMDIFFEKDFVEELQYYLKDAGGTYRGGKSRSNETTGKLISSFDRKYALVIGTNSYEKGKPNWTDLENPITDAKVIASLLSKYYGYEVTLLTDPSANQVIGALESLSKRMTSQDQFLCFIAGHGDYDPNFFDDGFLVLNESLGHDKDPYRRSHLPFTQIGNIIDNLPSEQVMLLVDVCFGGAFDQKLSNGPMRSQTGIYEDMSVDEMIASKSEKRTRIILSSGSLNVVPDGYNGKHSPFAARVISALESGGGDKGIITSTQLYDYVQWLPSKPFKGELKGNEVGSEYFLIFEPQK